MQNTDRKVLFETEHWCVRLVQDQTYLGYSVISLKRQEGKRDALSDLSKDEWLDFHHVVRLFEMATREAFRAVMFNWMCTMNGFYRKESLQLHLHWHVYPRYDQPIKLWGEIFEDPNFGHRVLQPNQCHNEVSEEIQKNIIDEIRKHVPSL